MRIKKEILFGGKIFDTEFDFKRPEMESVRQGAEDVQLCQLMLSMVSKTNVESIMTYTLSGTLLQIDKLTDLYFCFNGDKGVNSNTSLEYDVSYKQLQFRKV